jgi:hypothetical protein
MEIYRFPSGFTPSFMANVSGSSAQTERRSHQ